MKYLLFICFASGLKHNAVYESLSVVQDSLSQLAEEERLNVVNEEIPTVSDLEKNFYFNDDYNGILSNGTWFHIQELTVRNYIGNYESIKNIKI